MAPRRWDGPGWRVSIAIYAAAVGAAASAGAGIREGLLPHQYALLILAAFCAGTLVLLTVPDGSQVLRPSQKRPLMSVNS